MMLPHDFEWTFNASDVASGCDDTASNWMSDLTSSCWPHTWQEDASSTSAPLFTFLLFNDNTKYAFYFFSISLWLEMIAIVILECIAAAAPTALLIYYTILSKQESKQHQPKIRARSSKAGTTTTTTTSLLGHFVGWCVILPFWIVAPRHIADWLQVSNMILRFCVCVITPTVSIFRTLEAMYGFCPDYAVDGGGVGAYVLYFCSPLRLLQQQDSSASSKEPNSTSGSSAAVPTNMSQILHHLFHFLGYLLLTGLYQSLFVIYEHDDNNNVFPKLGGGPSSTPANYYSASSMWDVEIWKESILCAILFQLYLSTFAEGLMLATNVVTGKQTVAFSDNPMFASTSPSDFWGRRWNLLVHQCLKNGVYKPVRFCGGGHASLAVAATFLASALFHEWLLPSVFYDYPSTHGITIAFFAWQALLVMVEASVVGDFLAPLGKTLPRLLRTMLVIALGLPLAHWFCDTYIRSNFFVHGQMGLFMILPVDNESGAN